MGLAFILLVYGGSVVQEVLFFSAVVVVIAEFYLAFKKAQKIVIYFYALAFLVALAHVGLLAINFSQSIFLAVIVGSVLSDVAAFFAGGFFGKHKLPATINSYKSWEGVVGQIVGALFGVILVNYLFDSQNHWLLFLPIGVGSVCGDLLNSKVKRILWIKDWSNFLPGHGGLVDRLASLVGAALLSFYLA